MRSTNGAASSTSCGTALANGEIRPFYQPIVDPAGQIIAVEALVRWVHPVRGVLGVSEILPLAQMAGLAEAVDDCVLDMALDFAVRLAEAGHGDTEVHINIDPKVIAQPSFGVSFLERCRRAGANPTQLVVEITETDLLAPGASSLANMQKLRFAGIHVTIDDFGTGYSSLAHLLELPVDGVKIDRRFVAGIDVDPAATNLTTAIIGLSESLRLGCVAEGVEQPYQRDRLIELGCSAFQGWLFSPAVVGRGDAGDDAAHRPDRPRSDVPARPAVVDVPQHEPVGRCDRARRRTIERLQRRRHAGRRTATPADVDERADDAAHHLVAERRGGDLESGERHRDACRRRSIPPS